MSPLWPPVVLLPMPLSQPQALHLCSFGLRLVRRELETAVMFVFKAHLLAQPGSHKAGILPPPHTHF